MVSSKFSSSTLEKNHFSSFLFTGIFWLQMVLERYFSTSGEGTELVLPKQLDLQAKLQKGPPKDIDFYPE